MKYYIIAGEASGDLHSSNLMKELKAQDGSADFRCWGGDLMEKQGGVIVKHYKDLAFMGFTEVLMNIRTIMDNFKLCKKDILNYKPDVLILVDYPGFNLRMAEFAYQNNIKCFYYISPQVWAWKQSRVKKIKKFVDEMFVILPFEKEFYQNFDYNVSFVGHPLLDVIEDFDQNNADFRNDNNLDDKPIIAVLPGSRKQEIKAKLPIMLSMIQKFPEYQFVLAAAPGIDPQLYSPFINGTNVSIVYGKTYQVLINSDAAMVTSGTATLETALFDVPEVVCYKAGGKLSYYLAKLLVKVKYISLVNLVMDKPVVTELIQDDLNPANLENELRKLLQDKTYIEKIKSDYLSLKNKLGGKGASKRCADLMIKELMK
jgi:lipid-A-disaccharide synthase